MKTNMLLAWGICLLSAQVLAITPAPAPEPEPEPSPPNTGAVASGRYVLTNSYSNKEMEVAGASYNAGANVVQNDYQGAEHQQWNITDLGNGYYSIRAAHSGLALDVWEWNANDGADARVWISTESENQQWQISAAGNGTYSIV